MLFGAVVTTDKRSKKEKTELSDLRKSRHKRSTWEGEWWREAKPFPRATIFKALAYFFLAIFFFKCKIVGIILGIIVLPDFSLF